MARLSFIEDSAFDEAVSRLVTRVRDADSQAVARLERNVRDPFTLMAQALLYELDPKRLDLLDSQRSLAQAIAQAVGDFHQSVLGGMPGWRNHDSLVDLVHEERRIAAEIKNKHNTLNADNKQQVLENIVQYLRSRGGGVERVLRHDHSEATWRSRHAGPVARVRDRWAQLLRIGVRRT